MQTFVTFTALNVWDAAFVQLTTTKMSLLAFLPLAQ
jgi:hypothetical protein